MLFLVPTDVSLWDMNSAAEQTHLKGSSLMSGSWVLPVSRVLTGHPLLACMCHPQLQQSWHYVPNQSYIPRYHLALGQECLDHNGLVLWQKEHRGIGHGACSCNLFLFFYHAEIAVCNVIFSFPPDHWNGKWNTLPFTISPIPHVLYTFYSKCGERMAYPDSLVWLQNNHDMSSLQCQWFLLDRKNHITADITESVKITLALVINSYMYTNV